MDPIEIRASAAERAEEIQDLLDSFDRETMMLSTTYQMVDADSFEPLVEIGWPVVPVIFERFANGEWGMDFQLLLAVITKADPSSAAREPVGGDSGFVGIRVRDSAELWLEWGREQGLTEVSATGEEQRLSRYA